MDIMYLYIVSQGGTIKATYGWFADGSKSSAQDNNGNGYYYIGSLIYSNSNLESTDFSQGRIALSGNTQTIHYHHRDHLGSVRAITNGRIINRIKDKTQDAFYIVEKDSEGNYQRVFSTDENGNKVYESISFDYGTIESQRNIIYSPDNKTTDLIDIYKVRGDDNGMNLFRFFADNITNSPSKVEFSLAQTGIKGNKGLNFITTSHQNSIESGMSQLLVVQLFNGYTIRTLTHSHPKSPEASPSDLEFASEVTSRLIKRKLPIPEFYIYFTPRRTFGTY